MTAFTAIVDWRDSDVEDADEIRVRADSAAQARRRARAKWSGTKGATWPHCRITRITIFRSQRECALRSRK